MKSITRRPAIAEK